MNNTKKYNFRRRCACKYRLALKLTGLNVWPIAKCFKKLNNSEAQYEKWKEPAKYIFTKT